MSIVRVAGVGISPQNTSVAVGSNRNTSLTVEPANATNKSVTYTSTDPLIATVNASGVIRGVAVGTCQVRVQSNDSGLSAYVNVTVTA